MANYKLPKDWIIKHSKRNSGKVYYFNQKTHQSTWLQPTSDKINKISLEHDSKVQKTLRRPKHIRTRTPDHEIVCQRQSLNKRLFQTTDKVAEDKETLEVRVPPIKMHQITLEGLNATQIKLDVKHKSADLVPESSKFRNNETNASLSKNSYTKLIESKTVSLTDLNSDVMLVEPDKQSISLNRNCIEPTKLHVFYEKKLRKSLSTVNSENKTTLQIDQDKSVTDIKNKQGRGLVRQILTEAQRKRKGSDITIRKIISGNLPNSSQIERKTYVKKNLAKERMLKLRRYLMLDNKKFEGIDCSPATEKSLYKFSKTLPISLNKNLGLSGYYRNMEIPFQQSHNKILKDILHEDNGAMNNNNLQVEQNKSIMGNVLIDKLEEQNNQDILEEEMDWEPIKDEEITLEVEAIRMQLNRENCRDVTTCISDNTIELIPPSESQDKDRLYIVIDTNIFLSNLALVEEAKNANFKNHSRPFIVIPWTVICELDYLKKDKSKSESLCMKAREAIYFLNEHFSSKHPRIIGQTREQAIKNKKLFSLECPDDEILQCCLQIRELGRSVVLLSYDKNLCNKAMIHDIVALKRNDSLEKINDININDKMIRSLSDDSVQNSILSEELFLLDDVWEDIKTVIKDFFSVVIAEQFLDIYGTEWQQYVFIKPPWTVVTALKCIIKHWIAALSESFQRHSIHVFKELLGIFEHSPIGGKKLQEMNNILEKCNDVIQMVNAEKHYDIMTHSLNKITKIKKKCCKYISDINQRKLHDKIGIVKNIQQQEDGAKKTLQSFNHIYNYSLSWFPELNPPLLRTAIDVECMKPKIAEQVVNLAQNLNKLLDEANNCAMEYQTLLDLQQNMNTFLSNTDMKTINLTLSDIYYCVKLKEDILKNGLKQLKELDTRFRISTVHT